MDFFWYTVSEISSHKNEVYNEAPGFGLLACGGLRLG
jgi:hypothetical protein